MGEENTISSESLVGLSQREVSVKIDLHNMHLLSEQFQGRGCVRDIARLASVLQCESLMLKASKIHTQVIG